MPSANKPVPGQLIIQEALQVARAYSLSFTGEKVSKNVACKLLILLQAKKS
jgi:hypothetical protein